ncbi:MAG TPA: hypothetical protein VGI13_02115 [Candidatus Acidoferrum sp.]|jgi:tetratricopeptide (TPR) repeat protein
MNFINSVRRFFRAPAPEQPQPASKIQLLLTDAYDRFTSDDSAEAERLACLALTDSSHSSYPSLVEYALGLLGYLWMDEENYEKPISFLSNFIQTHLDNATALEMRARLLWYSGRQNEALADYDRVIELVPSDLSARVARGQVLVELSQPQMAIEDLEFALELNNAVPNARDKSWSVTQAYTRNGLGAASSALGEYSKAFEQFSLSIDLQPENAWVYYNRARAREKTGDFLAALSDYRKALTNSQPKLPEYKRKDAEAQIKQLAKLDPEEPS